MRDTRMAGDEERKVVVGVRLGHGANGMPLKFRWYLHGDPIGREGRIELNEGDIYIMSEKAVGFDTFKEPHVPTLRHAAGKDAYFKSEAAQPVIILSGGSTGIPPAAAPSLLELAQGALQMAFERRGDALLAESVDQRSALNGIELPSAEEQWNTIFDAQVDP